MNNNKFETISHLPLRVFNRVVLMANLNNDFGPEAATKYAEEFDEGERKQMFVMQTYIKQKGEAVVRKEVTKNLTLVADDE